MTGKIVRIHGVDDEPYGITTAVPNPGRRYEAGRKIVATLKRIEPGSDQSFLVDSRETAHHVARGAGFEIRTTKAPGGKCRDWDQALRGCIVSRPDGDAVYTLPAVRP